MNMRWWSRFYFELSLARHRLQTLPRIDDDAIALDVVIWQPRIFDQSETGNYSKGNCERVISFSFSLYCVHIASQWTIIIGFSIAIVCYVHRSLHRDMYKRLAELTLSVVLTSPLSDNPRGHTLKSLCCPMDAA